MKRFSKDVKSYMAIGFLVFAAALLAFLALYKFPPMTSLGSLPHERTPASIQKVFDFSYLDGQALQVAAKQRLITSLDVATSSDKSFVSINVGNFVLLDDQNQKVFACGYYDRLFFTFEAEGVSVDGEKPRLVIQGGCEIGANVNTLLPLTIPLGKILAQKPSNSELKFYESKSVPEGGIPSAPAQLTVQIFNTPTEWPKTWALIEVKFAHSQIPSRILRVASAENPQSKFPRMTW